MGISVTLETEAGAKLAAIHDQTNLLHRILPEPGDSDYPYLSCIDWYGNTVFNYLQAPQFLVELRSLEGGIEDPAAAELLEQIRKLAERLNNREDVHIYLKFTGD